MTTDMQIDFGNSSFSEGGQSEEEDERARREAEAMLALERRIAERAGADAGIIDPWQAEGYAPQERDPWQDRQRMSTATPQPLPEPVPELRNPWQGMPQMSVVDPSVQQPVALQSVPPEPVLASMPAAPEQSTPSPLPAPLTPEQQQPAPITPAEPPPMPVAGEATPDATTNPNAPTVTAGASAQALRQEAPQGAPAFAGGGATGLGQAQVPDRIAAGQPPPNMFARQQEAAQGQDDRRDRIRHIFKALAALGGMATIGSGGSVGGALPGAIGAMLVGDSNAEERLLASDGRSRELSDEDARRQQLVEQMQLRRQALQGTESNRAAQLGLRERELDAGNADRALRTGYAADANERAAALLDPGSSASESAREALVRFARTLPAGVQQSVLSGDLSGLNAEQAEGLRRSLGGVESGRQRSGAAGRGSGAQSNAAATGGLRGAGVVPDWYVAAIAQNNSHNPQQPTANDRASAQSNWDSFSPRERARRNVSADAQRMAQVLGRNIPGWEQAGGGAISEEQYRTAREAQSQLAAFDTLIDAAAGAGDEIDSMEGGRQLAARAGDLVGIELEDAVSEFNDARGGLVGILNSMANAGVLSDAERQDWLRQLPSISDFRGNISGTTRRMRAIQRRVRAQVAARMEVAGYRQSANAPTPNQPGTGANGQPVQGDAPVTGGAPEAAPNMVTITFRRPDGSTRSRQIDARQREHYIRRAPEGWTVVQ